MNIKTILTKERIKNLIIIALLVAVAYYWGMRWLAQERSNYFNAGAIQMRDRIFEQAKTEGQVLIGDSNGEQILLIPLEKGE